MSTEYSDDRPIKADCGHYVADHAELVEQPNGQSICQDCDEMRRQNGEA